MRLAFALLLTCGLFIPRAEAQAPGTGAITGLVMDPSGAAVSGAEVTATNEETGKNLTVKSQNSGVYTLPLLPPGRYRVDISKDGFKLSRYPDILVNVTETVVVNAKLQLGEVTEKVEVKGVAEQLQAESSTLGQITSGEMVSSLPLVTRNYTQIIGLNAGVTTDVNDARQIGRGGGGEGQTAPFSVAGSGSLDNNFQMDGIEINNLQGTGGFSGGIAIPNPDSIQEFKVQTSQYDASYGRNAGANVNVVTKSGTNSLHGDVWEYFRNEDLDANEFFRNLTGQPRPVLRQNQFGFDLGGPIKKDKLFFFTSYQGTRQLNGIDVNCSSTVASPPLTDDRSASAIGAIFQGQRGLFQDIFGGVGPAILADGSNIASQALALLQLKLPNGQFLFPTPQTDSGLSTYSSPCKFNEDQFITNGDFIQSARSTFSAKFFFANSSLTQTLPGGAAVPGYPGSQDVNFRNFSLTHTYVFSPNLLNQAEIGFHRSLSASSRAPTYTFSQIGATVPSFDDAVPNVIIVGYANVGNNGSQSQFAQNTIQFLDSFSYIHGSHAFRFGGSIARGQDNNGHIQQVAVPIFLSFPDFLLGLSGAANDTGISNIYESADLPGLFDRAYRVWEGSLYAQDDFKVTRSLTLNLGLRYDRLGDLGEIHGRNATFDTTLANPNPPVGGTLEGFVVSSNYPGTVPDGVTQLGNNLGIKGVGQNTWNPRLGFAWQLPYLTNRFVLRGGYGIYHSRLNTESTAYQLNLAQPFGRFRAPSLFANGAASWAEPIAPFNDTLPSFQPYSPDTLLGTTTLAPNLRPPIEQQYNLNLQTSFTNNLMLEVAYVGSRGLHLLEQLAVNQAILASPSNPVRGQTINSVANIQQRVPLLGWDASRLIETESEGASWYNALDVSLKKRFSHGLQFMAAYTFAKNLSTDTAYTSSVYGSGQVIGDQTDPKQRYGADGFTRPQRLVISYLYNLPGPKNLSSATGKLLGGWSLAGVITYQSGHWLTFTDNINASNAYGNITDRPSFAPGCIVDQLVTPGAVNKKFNNYLNASCFSVPPPLSVNGDGVATGFGNMGVGIVRGPSQSNFDFSAVKRTTVPWPSDRANIEFRAEFFNLFNHPQFADPDTGFGDSTFGKILNTSVNSRIAQLVLRLTF
jgi:hypothetical protein